MREIKFRAWHTPFGGNKFGQKFVYGNKTLSFQSMNPDSYVLEQYTGINDINGVEVYEGDIIKFHVVMLSPDDKVGYVKYYPEYGYSIMLSLGRVLRQEYWASGDKHTIEVIGNIHENEELLQ
ncbi:YopX family protein [Weissella confusa]|uniref:YopX family protein n=1 Tax=Weissella confusa TaxID=1583 RepID=UPI000B35E814|nr:YopX family protein [Weissella confusa]